MLNGERRWASSRRGGMTVIGKVPKPINLPSQRRENHGLDPNVEIVPKGTHSWGSRPSSSTSNAWGSPSLSPNATSSSDSPSHLSARPSSAEGGTRPSTAGSDKVHDSTPNAWSSNSRPSSASGVLTSNRVPSMSLRPHSAEPRPGSSQLSRFAEPSSDISVPGNGERLDLNKSDEFSLNTGDFPTLGTVKSSSSWKSAGSQDPSLQDLDSTAGLPMDKKGSENYSADGSPFNAEAKGKTDESRGRDNTPCSEDGPRFVMEKWDGCTPPYQNPGILPQHFSLWRGPPANNPPGGVWYGGSPSGPPPYGAPIPPGGFPMEPFHYYCSQGPASALPIPQQVSIPGTGPRGTHPRNGDMYRPQMPETYIRPGMPIRPGFFPGPVPYDGYYGHPMGYCRTNDHDLPNMGMTGGPPSIYGQFPNQSAHGATNSHIRLPGHGLNSEMQCLEEVESGHHCDPQPYRVLLKSHDNRNEKNEEQKQEETKRSSGFMLEETQTGDRSKEMNHSRASSRENDWSKDRWKDGEKDLKVGVIDEDASQNSADRASGSVVLNKVKSQEHMESRRVDRDHGRAVQNDYVAPVDPKSVASKDSSLIQKIEGLNAKARASDPRPDVMIVSDRPEKGHILHDRGTESSMSAVGAGNGAPYSANFHSAQGLSTEGKVMEEPVVSGPTTSRHGKTHNHCGKGRLNLEDADGFLNKPAVLDPLLPTPLEFSDVHRPTHQSSQPRKKYDGGYVPVTSRPGDVQAECAKMKQQRLKQKLEECSREQNTKTHMKLEELNRHMQVVVGSNSKTESTVLNNRQDDVAFPVESKKIYGRPALSNPTAVLDVEIFQQNKSRSTVGRFSNMSKEFQQEPPSDLHKKSFIINNQSVLMQQDAEIAEDNSNVTHIHTNVPSKQHRTGHKYKQSMTFEKNTQNIAVEPPKSEVNVADEVFTPVDAGADSSAHQRRQNNRGNRVKYKGDESSPANNLQSPASKESGRVSTASVGSVKLKSEPEETIVITVSKHIDVNQVEQHPGSVHEEVHGQGTNQWKSQYSHRAPRNQQVNRVVDKLHGGDTAVWTPVRMHNRAGVGEENIERTAVEDQPLSVKGDHPLQSSNLRSKRAEIERYVPKPVAKEMAQQGSVQHVAALDGQIKMADDAVQEVDTEPSSSVAVKESRTADCRQIRSGRGHGLWRQRCRTDDGLQVEQPHYFSQTSGNVQRLHEQGRRPISEEQPSKEQRKHRDEGLCCDSITNPCNASSTECQPQFVAPAGRNQGTPERGKCHPSLKATKYELDPDQKKSNGELVIAPEVSQTDPASASSIPRENHGILERSTLHWQPKSQPVSGQTVQAKRAADDGRNAAESGRPSIVKDPKEIEMTCDQSDFLKDKMHKEERQVDNSKRGRRPRSSTACPQSTVQVVPKSEELGNQQDQAGSSMRLRKSGNQSASPFVRTDENYGDWSSNKQDVRQHNVPAHRERHQYNSSYKYQPVGPHNAEDRSSHFDSLRKSSQGTGPRYKERAGQNGSRRGGGRGGVNFN